MKIFLFTLLVASASAWGMHSKVSAALPSANVVPNIVGGIDATGIEQFPWQCNLVIDNAYFCGCSVVSADWILTAAHCTTGSSTIVVTAGQFKRDVTTGFEQKRTAFLNQIFTHDGYSAAILANDIGAVQISPPFLFNTTYVQPIALPTAGVDAIIKVGDIVYATGWGKVGDGPLQGTAQTLQMTNMTVISQEECGGVYGDAIIRDGKFCTDSDATDFHGTCNGDSGGPIVKYGAQILRGITSFVHVDGCSSGEPDGYTRVLFQREWITNTTGI